MKACPPVSGLLLVSLLKACLQEERSTALPAALQPDAPRWAGEAHFCATMNPPCGRCNKPVYPTEKINCLDKVRSHTLLHNLHTFHVDTQFFPKLFFAPFLGCIFKTCFIAASELRSLFFCKNALV